NGINASDQVVGYSGQDAFVYDTNRGMVDLNALIDPLSGWHLDNATAINDAGQIVGTGINSDGLTHAILLMPVPEPSTLVLAAIAFAGLAIVRTGSLSLLVKVPLKCSLLLRFYGGLVGLLLMVLASGSAAAAEKYHLTDLGTLGGAESTAMHVNSSGLIV